MARRFARIVLIILCFALLAMPALAASSATNIEASASLAVDGSYTMKLKLQFRLDTTMKKLDFPVPASAANIQLFNGSVGTHAANGAMQVEIPSQYLTSHYVEIDYNMDGRFTYSEKDGFLQMDVPILCGFQYKVEALSFAIAVPEALDLGTDPVKFTSTTHGQTIEDFLTFQVEGNIVKGSLIKALPDGASVILRLTVPQEMFPQAKFHTWQVSFDDIAMYVLSGVALVYWLLFLRTTPPRRIRSTVGPEGLSAGELGTALIGQGGDLTMMVLSWAQMGYILIHCDKHGRVMLHKRMEMGNERSGYEQKIFRTLFGKASQVNGTSMAYARLVHKVASLKPENRGYYLRRSGSTMIFRLLLALVGALGGIALGIALGGDRAWLGILLAVFLAVFGFASSFMMQDFIRGLHLRRRMYLFIGLGLAAFWLLLGKWAAEPIVGVWLVGCQLLGGLAYGYGGMRSESGKNAMSLTLGLRRYFKSAPKPDLQRVSRQRPDYFFQMAPAAAALGVDAAFAKRFGTQRLPACPYLTTGMDGHMNARQWDKLLRRTIAALDAKALRLPIDRLLGRQ